MGLKFLFLFFIILSSCQKIQPLEVKQNDVSVLANNFEISDLHRMRVDKLFIVLFKDQLSEVQWTQIFKDTQKLSSNKRLLQTIEGKTDEESEKLRSQIIPENATLLQRLSESSVYLLNWSFGDENCKFLFKEVLNLVCKPRTYDNPLNGGLPEQSGLIQILTPNPITEDIKVRYLNLVLYKDVPRLNIQLRLRLEQKSINQFWFKGDVKILEHSFKDAPFSYGYSEMSLSK